MLYHVMLSLETSISTRGTTTAIFDRTGAFLRSLAGLAALLRFFLIASSALACFFTSNSACRSILACVFCSSFSLRTRSLSTRRAAASSLSNSFCTLFAAALALRSAVCSFLASVWASCTAWYWLAARTSLGLQNSGFPASSPRRLRFRRFL